MKTFLTFIISILTINCLAYNISDEGKEFIKKHESCVLTAYWDSNGYSIGYGHHSSDITKDMKITKAQANKYFNEDIKNAEAAVKRLINALPYEFSFSQGFIDGFVSFVYNTGEGGAKNSEFYNRLKKCRVRNGVMNGDDYKYTIAAIKTSRISCPGHKIRRAGEYKLMMND